MLSEYYKYKKLVFYLARIRKNKIKELFSHLETNPKASDCFQLAFEYFNGEIVKQSNFQALLILIHNIDKWKDLLSIQLLMNKLSEGKIIKKDLVYADKLLNTYSL
jgi:hypothetical protein